MDTYSSGEDLGIKTRKPYTITKQRQRWTEEEHSRFLEALKLYGRAWQRIEEHVGTKTAVQIRSHAQKFFTKLEREALVKGVPIAQALDIEIPPPRPKRKPISPYPRKTGSGTPTPPPGANDRKSLLSVSSFCTDGQVLDLEREPLFEKPGGDEIPRNAKENQDESYHSEVLTPCHEAPSASFSSANNGLFLKPGTSRNSCTFGEFGPMMVSSQDETNESYLTFEPKRNQKLVEHDSEQMVKEAENTSNLESSHSSRVKLFLTKKPDEMSQPDNCGLSSNDMQATQNYPRHVPVHVLDGSLGMRTQNVCSDIPFQESILYQTGGTHEHPNLLKNPALSSTTEHHVNESILPPHPFFTSFCNNQDNFQSYPHISSAFSSLIISNLLQNPAAHAAASFVAAFWPSTNMEASADSPAGTLGGLPLRQTIPAPSMAAIAAATVAAATSWWAAHGLLPLCTPIPTGFTCTPACTSANPKNAGFTATVKREKGPHDIPLQNQPVGQEYSETVKREKGPHDLPLQNQQVGQEYSEPLLEQHSAFKSPTVSTSETNESGGSKPIAAKTAADPEKAAAVTELHDSDNTNSRKLVDRFSCGSNTVNTPSSSEVETDALGKHETDRQESKEPDLSHAAGESNVRRSRSYTSTNDSWKEVSEGGRLAFKALFSREKLPQSFSPPRDLKDKGYQKDDNIAQDKQNGDEKADNASRLESFDLNSKTRGPCSSPQPQLDENNIFLVGKNDGERRLTMELGHGKLKARRTGFKPYKRCSVEAKESKVASVISEDEEKGPKRIRLEGEASA